MTYRNEIRLNLDDETKRRIDQLAKENDRLIRQEVTRALRHWVAINGNPECLRSAQRG